MTQGPVLVACTAFNGDQDQGAVPASGLGLADDQSTAPINCVRDALPETERSHTKE
ncbi:MAG: hypothetical protein ACK56F_18740 [bacterium]